MVHTILIQAKNKSSRLENAGQVSWKCGGRKGTKQTAAQVMLTTSLKFKEPGERIYSATSDSLHIVAYPLKVQGPQQDKPKIFTLVAQRMLTNFESGNAVHTIALLLQDGKGTTIDPGKDLKVQCMRQRRQRRNFNQRFGDCESYNSRAGSQSTVQCFLHRPIFSLKDPLTLDGLPKKETIVEEVEQDADKHLEIPKQVYVQRDGTCVIPVTTKLKNGKNGKRQVTLVSQGGSLDLTSPVSESGSSSAFETRDNGTADIAISSGYSSNNIAV